MRHRSSGLPKHCDSTVLPLRPPRSLERLGVGLLAAGLFGLEMFLALRAYEALDLAHPDAGAVRSLTLAAALCAFVFGTLVCPRTAPPVELSCGGMALPRSRLSRRTVRARYADVYSIQREGSGARGRLVIGVNRRAPFAYLRAQFQAADALDALESDLLRRIGASPGGARQLARIERRRAVARARTARPWVTGAAVLAIACGFGCAWVTGAGTSAVGLLRLGANAGWLVERGEWFRLVTGSLLHESSLHLAANGIALSLLGFRLERILGSGRHFVLAFGSALAGGIASAWLEPSIATVGASPVAYGLLGGWAVVSVRFLDELPAGLRLGSRSVWALFAVGIAVDVALPGTDVAAHAGGLLGGGLLACPLTRGLDLSRRRDRSGWIGRAAVLACALALAASVAAAIAYARRTNAAAVLRAAEPELARTDADSRRLNRFARLFAVSAAASPSQLAAARAAIERTLARDPQCDAMRATLAALESRLGELELRGGSSARPRDIVPRMPLDRWLRRLRPDRDSLEREAREVTRRGAPEGLRFPIRPARDQIAGRTDSPRAHSGGVDALAGAA